MINEIELKNIKRFLNGLLIHSKFLFYIFLKTIFIKLYIRKEVKE